MCLWISGTLISKKVKNKNIFEVKYDLLAFAISRGHARSVRTEIVKALLVLVLSFINFFRLFLAVIVSGILSDLRYKQ